jgi:formyl-CoA transferase
MMESTIAFAPDAFVNFKRYGTKVAPATRAGVSQSYAFRCQDGRLIALHLSSQSKFWEGLLTAIGRSDLATNPNFATREQRIANYKALAQELAKNVRHPAPGRMDPIARSARRSICSGPRR